MSPNVVGGGEMRDLSQCVLYSCTQEPNKLWISNSIFNLWFSTFNGIIRPSELLDQYW